MTTSTGKVLTFQTEEQKERYLARVSQIRQTPAPAATAAAAPGASPTPKGMGHTSLDDKPSGTGKVNVGAPTFTANYYMFAPETWDGKQLTLSVAYILPESDRTRSDGMRELRAYTWGTSQASGWQDPGGSIKILATPAAAQRISTLCGSTLQYNGMGVRVTLIKGQMTASDGNKHYAVLVSQ